MKKIRIANNDELADLIDWMHGHINDEDWPTATEDAMRWLCTLDAGTHEVPEHLVEAIEFGIEDWLDVLSNYEDSEPFETHVEEVAVE